MLVLRYFLIVNILPSGGLRIHHASIKFQAAVEELHYPPKESSLNVLIFDWSLSKLINDDRRLEGSCQRLEECD